MKKLLFVLMFIILIFLSFDKSSQSITSEFKYSHWLALYRKSNVEFLYFGEPSNIHNSFFVKVFKVKSGIPGERPTPLPKLLGREYWLITEKWETKDSFETAPYFLTLDIPVSDEEPFGPVPYLECDGQCNWILPGAFGLHGINGDETRLSDEGSSGCIRHSDSDIIYLYNILNPEREKIRYYIYDL